MEDLAPDFDVSDLAGELASLPESAPDAGGDTGTPHPDDGAWRIREKDQPAAEAAPKTIDQELEAAFDATAGLQDDIAAAAAWNKELRRLADQALQRAGVNPAERHAAGISRREAVRRLFQAEAALREDPVGAMERITAWYAPQDPAQRSALAQRVLNSLGYQVPGALAEADARELQFYRQQAQEREAQAKAAVPIAKQMLERFNAQHPDAAPLHPTMAMLIANGHARTLDEAYDAARRLQGMPGGQQAAAQAEAERRRQEVAKARAAGTPQTKSAPTRAIERRDSDKSLEQLLHETADQLGL